MLKKRWCKVFLFFCLLGAAMFVCNFNVAAQENKSEGFQLYKVYADAEAELKYAKMQATKEQKHVLIFVGGNWCIWCKRLDAFLHSDKALETLLDNYKVVHINYSKQNKNEKVLESLHNPQQYGFPVIVLLDEKGNYMLTQKTDILEQGSGYDREKVSSFLEKWTYKYINNKK